MEKEWAVFQTLPWPSEVVKGGFAMGRFLRFVRRWGLEIALVACVAHLGWLVYAVANAAQPGVVASQRNWDFPNTYIERIHLDLTSPKHYVTLTWAGPHAASQDTGPFRSSPGQGWGTNDCNDPVESNCPNSMCTPKGLRKVEGLEDCMRSKPHLRYLTVIDKRRAIGFHSHPTVPPYPASQGCVRLEPYAARLIHDNSIAGTTEILVDGTWTKREQGAGRGEQQSSSAVDQ